jgi:hypothetical protein
MSYVEIGCSLTISQADFLGAINGPNAVIAQCSPGDRHQRARLAQTSIFLGGELAHL